MREILEKLINEEISIEECERLLKADTILEFDEVAKFDKSRSSRTGFPEAVFSPSKDYGDLLLIINNYFTSENPENLIVTKLSSERYENLAENYTDKKLPGVGVSIGLTRLFYKLNELNLIKADKKSISDILIVPMTENKKVPLELATNLRNLGINTEIYLNNKKIKAKMKYVDKLAIPYVIVIGDDEIANNTVKVKKMETGEEKLTDFNAESVKKVIKGE